MIVHEGKGSTRVGGNGQDCVDTGDIDGAAPVLELDRYCGFVDDEGETIRTSTADGGIEQNRRLGSTCLSQLTTGHGEVPVLGPILWRVAERGQVRAAHVACIVGGGQNASVLDGYRQSENAHNFDNERHIFR